MRDMQQKQARLRETQRKDANQQREANQAMDTYYSRFLRNARSDKRQQLREVRWNNSCG